MTKHDQSLARQIAAEVAARYGVAVAPGAVQIVPRGVSGVDYADLDGRNGWQRRNEAVRRNQARARRLRAAAMEVGSEPADPVMSPEAEADARHRAQLLALLAEGVSRDDLAARMGMSDVLLAAFAKGQRIPLPKPPAAAKPPRLRKPKQAKPKRKDRAVKSTPPSASPAKCGRNELRTAARIERQKTVRALVADGHSIRDMAAMLEVSNCTIMHDVVALGLRPRRAETPEQAARSRRLAWLKNTLGRGVEPRDAAARLGKKYNLSRSAVTADFRAIGQPLPKASQIFLDSGERVPVSWTKEQKARHLAQRAEIRAAALAGASLRDLRAKFGITVGVLERHMRAIRADGLPPGAETLPAFDRYAETRVRHARIEALRRQGMTIDAIAAETGASSTAIWVVLKKAGISAKLTGARNGS